MYIWISVCADGKDVLDPNKDLGDGLTCDIMAMMGPSAVESEVLSCGAFQVEGYLAGCCVAKPKPTNKPCDICDGKLF